MHCLTIPEYREERLLSGAMTAGEEGGIKFLDILRASLL